MTGKKEEVLKTVRERIEKLRKKAVEDGKTEEDVQKKILDAFDGM